MVGTNEGSNKAPPIGLTALQTLPAQPTAAAKTTDRPADRVFIVSLLRKFSNGFVIFIAASCAMFGLFLTSVFFTALSGKAYVFQHDLAFIVGER